MPGSSLSLVGSLAPAVAHKPKALRPTIHTAESRHAAVWACAPFQRTHTCAHTSLALTSLLLHSTECRAVWCAHTQRASSHARAVAARHRPTQTLGRIAGDPTATHRLNNASPAMHARTRLMGSPAHASAHRSTLCGPQHAHVRPGAECGAAPAGRRDGWTPVRAREERGTRGSHTLAQLHLALTGVLKTHPPAPSDSVLQTCAPTPSGRAGMRARPKASWLGHNPQTTGLHSLAGPRTGTTHGVLPRLKKYGAYANIRYVLQHFGGDLATEQRGSKAINVCPWSRLDGAGHSTWRAGKHCRPTHLQRDHAADPAQRDQALAMLASVMPGGQAGPFASAQARSRALMLPTGARPAEERGDVAVGGVAWSNWACSTARSGDFCVGYSGKYVRQTSRGGARRTCRVPAGNARLGRGPTGTGTTSPSTITGGGWSTWTCWWPPFAQ